MRIIGWLCWALSRLNLKITLQEVPVALSARLADWAATCKLASDFPVGEDRLAAIETFCVSFVPGDVAEDEMKEYAKSLGDDDVSLPPPPA